MVVNDQGHSTESVAVTIETAGQPEVRVEIEPDPANGNGTAPFYVEATLRAMGSPPITLVVNWGDGASTVVPNYQGGGVGSLVTHTYQEVGTYTAGVYATDRLEHTAYTEQVFTAR